MDQSERPEDERNIDILFRNGNITVFGIVLAFSLGFLNSWTSNPNEWRLDDLPTLVLISLGIVFQGVALWQLLRLNSLQRKVFESGTRKFAIGLVLTASGMLLSIAIDVARTLI